jgi:hypothetical protein
MFATTLLALGLAVCPHRVLQLERRALAERRLAAACLRELLGT